jgi:hypothetical protein
VPRARSVVSSLLAWAVLGIFWLIVTRGFHPTRALAIVVTASLIGAYASAAYINHLVLIPRYFGTRRYRQYVLWLLAAMASLTAVALTVIRTSYVRAWGPDPDPHGLYKHFAIDFVGMVVHVALAAAVVWLVRNRPSARRPES